MVAFKSEGSEQPILARYMGPDARYAEKNVSSNIMCTGPIFSAERVSVITPDGSVATRDVVRNNGGACVVAIQDGKLCLVRQWRITLDRQTFELPAGKRDGDEDPAVCAARELKEESGLVADSLELIARSRGTIGFSDELTSIYWAHGLHQTQATPDPEEFIDTVWVPLPDVLAAIQTGELEDSKTIIGALIVSQRLQEGDKNLWQGQMTCCFLSQLSITIFGVGASSKASGATTFQMAPWARRG